MEHRQPEAHSVYREYLPRPELRPYVRALAWFGPVVHRDPSFTLARESYIGRNDALTPSFAAAQSSLLFPLGVSYSDLRWHDASESGPIAMGAMTRATPPGPDRQGMAGAYLTPLGSATLLGVPAAELTDRVIPLADIWKNSTLSTERPTLDGIERLLCRHLTLTPSQQLTGVRIASLATHVDARAGGITVAEMAELAGVSRQHLRRLFREHIGVTPKQYSRLARFRAGLRLLGESARRESWSRLAALLGYADQSHLIADFREFSGFTPTQLAAGRHFHPFVGEPE